jgi:hypothetical protein
MPPKHRQLHTPRPKASGNAYQALVDPPHDGKSLYLDGGDERTDGYDNNNVVNANPRDSGLPAPTHSQDIVLQWIGQNILLLEKQIQSRTTRMESALATASEDKAHLNSKVDSLLQKMDTAWTENTALCEAYCASREETAALKAAMDALTKTLDENIATTTPPSPDTMTSSTTMEEMMMPLTHVQHDIQDVLDAVRNPPGRRKRRTSDQDNKPTMPTNRRRATQGHREASPEHSLMHSHHATSAAQEALDALMIKYPPRQLAIVSTSTKPTPPPSGPAMQDTPLPNAPSTAPVETDGWKTVEGKATQRKKQNEEAGKKRVKEMSDKPPMTKNGRRGKNSHQPQPTNTSAKKTWADVVKNGGINVQIVLGNGNLGLTTPMKMRGERRGGAARRLAKKGADGERGTTGRGKDGLEEIIGGGNIGGQMGKHGRGRVEERGEPGVAASV